MKSKMESRPPHVGDLVFCTDGDMGIILETFEDNGLQVKVRWNNDAKVYIDAWNSRDCDTRGPMFSIVSKAYV